MLRFEAMDHIVLVTPDVERSVAWYCDTLGLEPERLDEWRSGKAPFPSVRVSASTVIDVFQGTRDGQNMDHVCLAVEPTDLAAFAQRAGVAIETGPAPRWGARGMGTSIYIRDPDHNLVELRYYAEEG